MSPTKSVTQLLQEAPKTLSDFEPKVTPLQQQQICAWLAEFKTPKEIAALLKHDYQIEMTPQNISRYQHTDKWRPVVERLRQEWAAGVMQQPIAHVRHRLEKLQNLIERAEAQPGKDSPHKRQEVASYLRQAMAELQESKINQTNITSVIYMGLPDQDLVARGKTLMAQIQRFGGKDAIIQARAALPGVETQQAERPEKP